jgi:hypothetical protein
MPKNLMDLFGEKKEEEVPKEPKKPESPKETPKTRTWLDSNETILIFGLPKHGKTYAYCSVIDEVIKNGGKAYIISTDAGFARTASAYFGKRVNDVIDKIHVEIVYNINGIRNYYTSIRPQLKPQDLLVLDLVSDVWEWAQIDFVERLAPDGDVTEFIAGAMRDVKSFGLFDENKWHYIKSLHKFVEDIIIRKPCNFIGVATEKDTGVEVVKGKATTRNLLKDLGYEELGVRAGGNKLLPYKFETVLRIGFENGSYFLQVCGDRGYKKDLVKQNYGKNMYSTLKEWRRRG